MKTHAIEDFAEIARNRKRINDEQTWRAKDAGYGDAQIKELPGVAGTLKPLATLTCHNCGFLTTDPAGDCDGRCHG